MMNEVLVRQLRGSQEGEQAEDLQLLVWGGSERDIFPRDAMRALEHIGGLVAGAIDRGRHQVVGLVVGLPTAKAHLQHSHLLAVHPQWRGTGLAQRLKEFQRDWCVARGISQIEWTYDPLRALNAHFNIHRLGATAHEYLDDFYGEMGGINAGIPSDRLVAVWQLTEAQRRSTSGEPGQLLALNDPLTGTAAPLGAEALAELAGARLYIPGDLPDLLKRDPAGALAWRLGTRQAFRAALEAGLQVTDFIKGEQPFYVFTRR